MSGRQERPYKHYCSGQEASLAEDPHIFQRQPVTHAHLGSAVPRARTAIGMATWGTALWILAGGEGLLGSGMGRANNGMMTLGLPFLYSGWVPVCVRVYVRAHALSAGISVC